MRPIAAFLLLFTMACGDKENDTGSDTGSSQEEAD